ncbi:MAG: PrsW family intramembrane metalloprotease [Clostridiales bacterium]|nr:PrsW family intramembrane metalloprotease [Clostridiales bacterium]
MLFALALIPVIALLIFIYVRDKKEKEPIGLLIGLFFAGMGTCFTAMILEFIGEALLNAIFYYESMIKSFIFALCIVGPAEELGKYAVLRLITWKNKNFNYSYDAIVYAVFVSLGFACFENVGYCFMYGLGTALLRMFTAVPGHACFAVFMGFFYSKAKQAQLRGKKGEYAKFNALTLLVPIIGHGLYDGIIMSASASDYEIVMGLGALLWLGYVIVMFTISGIMVFKASKNDYCIVTVPAPVPGAAAVQTIYRPQVAGTWTCSCGITNNFNFCSACGKPRPMINTPWYCPECGTLSSFNFCGNCGCAKPKNAPVPGVLPASYSNTNS